jgi:hypothetical protein
MIKIALPKTSGYADQFVRQFCEPFEVFGTTVDTSHRHWMSGMEIKMMAVHLLSAT